MAHLTLVNAGVDFTLYQSKARSLKRTAIRATIGGMIGVSQATGRTTVQALTGIDLDIRAGDRVALIGHNGAGKTTLLRVLGGIYRPTVGAFTFSGHRVPLFDIGLGLDEEATGYENIVLRALVMGATRKEIDERTADIAEFSQLGDFLAMPVRTYSSGMMLRLLFAVATSINGDILLMDEWLSAGDKDFSLQANQRLQKLVDNAHILVLASHDLSLIRQVCNLGVWLEAGAIKQVGPIEEVVDAYVSNGG